MGVDIRWVGEGSVVGGGGQCGGWGRAMRSLTSDTSGCTSALVVEKDCSKSEVFELLRELSAVVVRSEVSG